MKKIALVAATALIGGLVSLSAPALAGSNGGGSEDACAGQTWPNLSDDCIKQIVTEVCKAGGGGDTCGQSTSSTARPTKLAPRVTKQQFQRHQLQRAR